MHAAKRKKNTLKTYNKEIPYQTYERIKFGGLRWSVEKRIFEYNLKPFLKSDYKILDIGSNFGFFVNEFAIHCKLAHGIEPNKYLNEIGRCTSEYLKINNKTNFFDCTFESFNEVVKYNVIFSLAAYYTADGIQNTSPKEYFGKIYDLLENEGTIFYESTSFKKEKNDSHYQAQKEAIEYIKKNFKKTKNWITNSGSKNYYRSYASGIK